MKLHVRQPPPITTEPVTTQAAEGMPRRSWTIAEIEAIQQAGIILEDERFELIGGEIVPMAAKGAFHETVKKELQRDWFRRVPADVDLVTETTFRLSERDFLEPDFVFWPRALGITGLKPEAVQLLVEVSDSSLAYDLGRKATTYAGLGLPDYWTINAQTLITRIHREPRDGAFQSVADVGPGEMLTPLLLPSLAVRLADLGLMPTAA